jgi:hypothetical protein
MITIDPEKSATVSHSLLCNSAVIVKRMLRPGESVDKSSAEGELSPIHIVSSPFLNSLCRLFVVGSVAEDMLASAAGLCGDLMYKKIRSFAVRPR